MFKKMKKGQAAMEFLMTYGWAILVVLVAIGALAYFGVLDPNRLLPARCTVELPFSCSDQRVTDGEIQLGLSAANAVIIRDIVINGSALVGDQGCGVSYSLGSGTNPNATTNAGQPANRLESRETFTLSTDNPNRAAYDNTDAGGNTDLDGVNNDLANPGASQTNRTGTAISADERYNCALNDAEGRAKNRYTMEIKYRAVGGLFDHTATGDLFAPVES